MLPHVFVLCSQVDANSVVDDSLCCVLFMLPLQLGQHSRVGGVEPERAVQALTLTLGRVPVGAGQGGGLP